MVMPNSKWKNSKSFTYSLTLRSNEFNSWRFLNKILNEDLFFHTVCRRTLSSTVMRSWFFLSFWAGSWKKQSESRITSSPAVFPNRFIGYVNRDFLPLLHRAYRWPTLLWSIITHMASLELHVDAQEISLTSPRLCSAPLGGAKARKGRPTTFPSVSSSQKFGCYL